MSWLCKRFKADIHSSQSSLCGAQWQADLGAPQPSLYIPYARLTVKVSNSSNGTIFSGDQQLRDDFGITYSMDWGLDRCDGIGPCSHPVGLESNDTRTLQENDKDLWHPLDMSRYVILNEYSCISYFNFYHNEKNTRK